MVDTKPQPRDDTSVSLRDHVDAVLQKNADRNEEVFKQIDLRYQQRYDAQIKAVEAAFLAQQTAMQAALLAAEKAVQTALQAAEKAVTKAEIAAEKRFDSVNEFREAYKDIIALQMPRAEAEQRLASLATASEQRFTANAEKAAEALLQINTLRNDAAAAKSKTTGYVAALGSGLTILTVVMAILAFVLRH